MDQLATEKKEILEPKTNSSSYFMYFICHVVYGCFFLWICVSYIHFCIGMCYILSVKYLLYHSISFNSLEFFLQKYFCILCI